jgi:hypothetical protein
VESTACPMVNPSTLRVEGVPITFMMRERIPLSPRAKLRFRMLPNG